MSENEKIGASGAMKPGKALADMIERDGLRMDAIDSKPVNAEWDAERWHPEYGETEGWDYWKAGECDECGEIATSVSGECSNGHEAAFEGPMMSYYYPLPDTFEGNEEEGAKAIASLPLCVVRVGPNYGLALTGGGMDLSWEICEAFIRLGYYPPAHFAANLPRMAGKEREVDAPLIASIAYEALRRRLYWLESDMAYLARLWEDFFPLGTAHRPEVG